MTELKEKNLEEFIEEHLTGEASGYRKRDFRSYDRGLCLDVELLFEFLQDTQRESLERLEKIYGADYKAKIAKRLFKQIQSNKLITVLRSGITDNGVDLTLMYDKPNSAHNEQDSINYGKNIFSITRQLHYSAQNEKSLDMGIFINGIPIATIELKNELTGQSVSDAIRQYKNDRDPKEELFRFGRCLVHFALDSQLIFMTTKLNGAKTHFLPFNRGLNSGKADLELQNGAGNPSSNGVKTAYLWENILQKDSLTNIIKNFVQYIKDDDKLIFPRFHQLDVVRGLLDSVKSNGVGKRYLIQHSAGSGKSNSISWLAHQLVGLFDTSGTKALFDTVIVVTDRTVLDKQIQDNIKQFHHVKGVVEPITHGSKHLKESLEEGKKIVISTIQKFPYIADDITKLSNKKFAVIIDEAHSSQSGKTAQGLGKTIASNDDEEELTDEDAIVELIKSKKFQPNASYFAFTATPKQKTLELFGEKRSDGKYQSFHLYSMKQAIEEGFILDVLKNYTTYNSYYHLIKAIENDPKYDKKRASSKLRQFVEKNEVAIERKTEIMAEHFYEHTISKIKGTAKAMVVTGSREHAVKYFFAFKQKLANMGSKYKAVVAFSGSVKLDGSEYTEAGLNGFSDSKTKEKFHTDEYKFLIVANKYQTGFDEPLLHTMYVDKKLGGVTAVQTLSRLNRICPNKEDTFVLDFYNAHTDIYLAFKDYYETTALEEGTDPNKLFDLKDSLDEFQIYATSDIDEFVAEIMKGSKENIVHRILDRVKDEFDKRSVDEQGTFVKKSVSFIRTYSFLSQILPYESVELEKLSIFLSKLLPKLELHQDEDLAKGILNNIDFDSYRLQLDKQDSITLGGAGILKPSSGEGGNGSEPELDLLSNIVQSFNDKFGDIDWGEDDKVKRTLKNISDDVLGDEEFIKSTKNTDKQNMKITFDKVLNDKFQDYISDNFSLFQKYTNDEEFKRFITAKLFEVVVNQINPRL